MKNLLPLLSIGIIATAALSHTDHADVSPAESNHSAGNTQVYNADGLSSEYQQFANLLNKQKSTTSIVAKGKQKTSLGSPYTASVVQQAAEPTVLPVFDQPDIKPKHQQIAHDALTKLPQKCWNTLKNFYVRYDNPKNRGLAGATTMILDGNVSDAEFRALFMHEIGHVFDLNQSTACLGGTITSGISEFKDGATPMYNDDPSVQFYRISWQNAETMKQGQTAANFVSGYAATNIFEDFAESHTLFVLHNDEFRAMAMQNYALALKYNFFVAHMYPNGVFISDSEYTPEGKRVWDTTKLPYKWL